MNSLFNDFQTALNPDAATRSTSIHLSCHTHFHPVKKVYFNKETNHQKELEFLEKTNIFVIELFTPSSYSPDCKIHYEIYSDKNNHSQQKLIGVVKNNSPAKTITIVADTEEDEFFVQIKIVAPDNNVLEVCHQFVSQSRAEKSLNERQKKSDGNVKYLEENTDNMEEIIEYASFTRAFIAPTGGSSVDLLGLFSGNGGFDLPSMAPGPDGPGSDSEDQ